MDVEARKEFLIWLKDNGIQSYKDGDFDVSFGLSPFAPVSLEAPSDRDVAGELKKNGEKTTYWSS